LIFWIKIDHFIFGLKSVHLFLLNLHFFADHIDGLRFFFSQAFSY
jgi:hypothetical protein